MTSFYDTILSQNFGFQHFTVQSYEKSSEKPNKFGFFRDRVTFSRSEMKIILIFFR